MWCATYFEKCLRSASSVEALRRAGLQLVPGYPRCFQDFNAIENAWDILKRRLEETLPSELESRDRFITRLRAAVLWMNRNQSERLWKLSTNQKERADECLATKPPGGRTSF